MLTFSSVSDDKKTGSVAAPMKFNKDIHQKVRYDGQLYVVILEEFPDYRTKNKDYPVVLHPIGNDWIVRITNPTVRKFLTVRKGSSEEVAPETME